MELEKNIIFGTLIQFVEMLLGLRIEAISSKFVHGSKSGKHMQIIKVMKLQQSKIASCKMDPSKMYLFIESASFSGLPIAMLVYKYTGYHFHIDLLEIPLMKC